jgi:hypothetical protein
MRNLWTALAVNEEMNSTTEISLQNTIYRPFKTTMIKNALGLPNDGLKWVYNNTDEQFEIYDSTNTNKKLIIKFSSFDPSSYNISNFLPTVKGFVNITGNNQDGFIVKGVNASGAAVVTITGSVEKYDVSSNISQNISMSECGTATPIECDGAEYQLADDLGAYIQDLIFSDHQQGFEPTQSAEYTSLIESFMPYGLTGSDVEVIHGQENGLYTETAYLNYYNETDTCTLKLYSTNPDEPLTFGHITSLGELVPCGTMASDGSYYQFYMLANYTINSIHYSDTVYGESACLPLKICACPQTSSVDLNECRKEGTLSGQGCWRVSYLLDYNYYDNPKLRSKSCSPVLNPTEYIVLKLWDLLLLIMACLQSSYC